jgi:hypothetical protein
MFFCLDTKEPKSQGCLNFYCFLRQENPRKQTRPPEADSNSVFLAQANRHFHFLENYVKIQKANQYLLANKRIQMKNFNNAPPAICRAG